MSTRPRKKTSQPQPVRRAHTVQDRNITLVSIIAALLIAQDEPYTEEIKVAAVQRAREIVAEAIAQIVRDDGV